MHDLYGPKPIIEGLERCEDFRNTVAPEDRFLAVAGLYNTEQIYCGENCRIVVKFQVQRNARRNIMCQEGNLGYYFPRYG